VDKYNTSRRLPPVRGASFDEPRPTVFLVPGSCRPIHRVRGASAFAISVSPSGDFPPGNSNAITDVRGVAVGHSTIIRGEGRLVPGAGRCAPASPRFLPSPTNIFEERVLAGAFILNGAGELAGLTQAVEWGLIETPICLTNTLSVGQVGDAIVKYMINRYPGIGEFYDVIIPWSASATTATSTTPRAGTSPTPTSSRRSTRRHPARSPRAWWARAPA